MARTIVVGKYFEIMKRSKDGSYLVAKRDGFLMEKPNRRPGEDDAYRSLKEAKYALALYDQAFGVGLKHATDCVKGALTGLAVI